MRLVEITFSGKEEVGIDATEYVEEAGRRYEIFCLTV
jgi:hypothetical protein